MKIIGINGSHRPGKGTAAILQAVLDEAKKLGAETELVELSALEIKFCTSCNACLRAPVCSITDDDMVALAERLKAADGILLGSPVYWMNVTTLMKNFMDRSRFLHMTNNQLAGKIGGAVTQAGLKFGGQAQTLAIMEEYLKQQGLLLADCRDHGCGTLLATGVAGSLMDGMADGQVKWQRSALDDESVAESAKQLGRNMVHLIKQTGGS